MGTTLTGATPQDTYDSLIKVTDNGPLSGSLKVLSDGLGNDSTLSLSTAAASIAGTLAVTGDAAFDTDTLFVDVSAGNVGIGTSAPVAKFEIDKTANNTISQANANFYIGSKTLDVGLLGQQLLASPYSYVLQVGTQSMIAFAPLSLNPLGGNVGIGTTAPAVPLDVVGNIRSSTGILFGADTAAANLLDDYEEGTWTPTNTTSGYTISSSSGKYTKIGRQVTIQGKVNFSAVNGSSNSAVGLNANPFSASDIFTGLCREDTSTGVSYVASLQNVANTIEINSMDGVATTSQRPIAISETYVFTITYFV